jgi:hypothetical protein
MTPTLSGPSHGRVCIRASTKKASLLRDEYERVGISVRTFPSYLITSVFQALPFAYFSIFSCFGACSLTVRVINRMFCKAQSRCKRSFSRSRAGGSHSARNERALFTAHRARPTMCRDVKRRHRFVHARITGSVSYCPACPHWYEG